MYDQQYPQYCRDLLWSLGGDRLPYRPDAEIDTCQQLGQQRVQAAVRGETLDLRAACANLLKLQ